MIHRHRRRVTATASLAALLSLGACDTNDAAARNAAEATKRAGDNAAAELRDASAKAAVVTEQAAQMASRAAVRLSEKLEDEAITAKVTTGLAADKNLSAMRVDVITRDGVVTLKGPAPSAAARERASEIARNVQGVTSVSNQLKVQPG